MDKQTEDGAFEIAVDFGPAPDPQSAPPADHHMAVGDPAEAAAPGEPVAEAASPPSAASFARRIDMRANLPLLLAGLATFAALVATIGLVVVSRNVAETNQRIAALQTTLEQRSVAPAVAPVPAPRTPAALLAAPIAGPGDKPASIEEVRALLFALRKDLVSYQAMGGNAGWVGAIRDAQAELANRLGMIVEKVDRIDRRLNPGPEPR